MDSSNNISFFIKEPKNTTTNPTPTPNPPPPTPVEKPPTQNKTSTDGRLNTTSHSPDIIQNRIKEFIETVKPVLTILTPAYGSVVYVNYLTCLINTLRYFDNIGIKVNVEFCKSDSLVSRARNNLIAKAMTNTATTHIIFIDADIAWDPMDIIKLMMADKAIVGGLYPLKAYDWDKLIKPNQITGSTNYIKDILERKRASQISNLISDTEMLQFNMVRYNANFLTNMLNIENNLTQVRHLATGFMMMKRSTIEQMMKGYPSTKYTDDVGFLKPHENKYAYALFDCGVEDDHYYSEDWLFCHRWTKLGGNVYLDVSINLTHTGIEDFRGSFIASLI